MQRSSKKNSVTTDQGTTAPEEVSALARGLTLLRAVADAPTPPSNRELAQTTGIPKATVSRLTGTLQSGGYLRQLPGERYALGAAVLHLGNAYLRGFDFRQQARPYLAELAEASGGNVHLGVRDGVDILLIDTLRPETALILSRLDVGSRMAIATSAAGRAYLSGLAPVQRKALLDEIRQSSGADWPQISARLDAALTEFAEHGYCSSFGEWHADIHAMAVPLHGPRGELYVASVGGPAYMLPRDMLVAKVAPRLVQCRRAIERHCGLS